MIGLGAYLYRIYVTVGFLTWSGFETKTLWDVLDLAIVPLMLAIGAVFFNWQQKKREVEIEDKRAQTEREIASDRSQENALQTYLDRLTELLLEKGLRESRQDDEVRTVARTRTLVVLRELDGNRKGLLVRFLFESHLITNRNSIIYLNGADLSGVNLAGARLVDEEWAAVNLGQADLTKANLRGAELSGANLYKVCLSEADLESANLMGADLREADLRRADLACADMSMANLSKAKLDWVSLILADLTEADMSEAYLTEAELEGANLSGANLSKAQLGGANLSKAHLNGVSLRGANLHMANLMQADLSDADLSYADLQRAKVSDRQLAKARSLAGANMPQGGRHE